MKIISKKVFYMGLIVLSLGFLSFIPTISTEATTLQNNDSTVVGGWSEETGYFQSPSTYYNRVATTDSRVFASSPRHTGRRENTVIGGTTHSRAHGWTTWQGVYHYTRARMELWGSVVSDSGRVYGWHGTEAASPWHRFNPYDFSPQARTYYGR